MAERRMKSDQVRTNWRDVLDHIRSGGTVIVEHYNRPIARIAPLEDTMTAATVTRESLAAWLGDNHGLTEEEISTLLDKAVAIGHEWPDTNNKQRRMDYLWWAYQKIVTAGASSREDALDTIHGKGRTGIDPYDGYSA
jgi:antitoxin (DNA-binding transcriptional repressor) of toxin-antitoxin stability system